MKSMSLFGAIAVAAVASVTSGCATSSSANVSTVPGITFATEAYYM